MILPYINEIPTTRQWNDVFYGYNHNLRIGEGEFYDMKNMTGDDFPVLSPRRKRGTYLASIENPGGLIAKDSLCYVDGGDFVINGYHVPLGLKVEYDEEGRIKPKQLVSMGAYVIIMPDKKYVNTNNFETDNGSIEEEFESTGKVTFEFSMMNGEAYAEVKKQPIAPTIAADATSIPAWIDTSTSPAQFKIYSTATELWSAVATTYVKIGADGIGTKFNVGDSVTITGVTAANVKEGLDNRSVVIASKGENFIVVGVMISENGEQDDKLTVTRSMPDMDFICESGNRLWGCFYGVKDGRIVNEIYSSKLGDFRNWYSYQGTAADSYAVTVGTDGEFTGAVTHLGYPIFFKENYMHKIYGNFPSNFQVQTTACRGVQDGCSGSITTINEVLYYKARSGVVAYDGSLPMEISAALGDETYDNATAGYLGNKYYISMRDSAGDYNLFVYDTQKAMWHREDKVEALAFCNCRGNLYFIDYRDTNAQNTIKSVKSEMVMDKGNLKDNADTAPVIWEAITGIIGTDSPDKKYISRLDVRMKLEPNAKVSFYADYDSLGEWELLYTMTGRDLKSFAAPVKPKRCDHFRLKICGVGNAKIYSICKTVEWGSDK